MFLEATAERFETDLSRYEPTRYFNLYVAKSKRPTDRKASKS